LEIGNGGGAFKMARMKNLDTRDPGFEKQRTLSVCFFVESYVK
jgi:hypothetical protein